MKNLKAILAEFDEKFGDLDLDPELRGVVEEIKQFISQTLQTLVQDLRGKEKPRWKGRINTFEDGQGYGEVDGFNEAVREHNKRISDFLGEEN